MDFFSHDNRIQNPRQYIVQIILIKLLLLKNKIIIPFVLIKLLSSKTQLI